MNIFELIIESEFVGNPIEFYRVSRETSIYMKNYGKIHFDINSLSHSYFHKFKNPKYISISYIPKNGLLKLPDSVKHIYIQYFENLENIVFPNSEHCVWFEYINEYCDVNMDSIRWNEGLVYLNIQGFYHLCGLENVVWPKSLKTLKIINMDDNIHELDAPGLEVLEIEQLKYSCGLLQGDQGGSFSFTCPDKLKHISLPDCDEFRVKWSRCIRGIDYTNFIKPLDISDIPEDVEEIHCLDNHRILGKIDVKHLKVENSFYCNVPEEIDFGGIQTDTISIETPFLESTILWGGIREVSISSPCIPTRIACFMTLCEYTDPYCVNLDKVKIDEVIINGHQTKIGILEKMEELKVLKLEKGCNAFSLDLWTLPSSINEIHVNSCNLINTQRVFDLTKAVLPANLKEFHTCLNIIPKAIWPKGFTDIYIKVTLGYSYIDMRLENVSEWDPEINIHFLNHFTIKAGDFVNCLYGSKKRKIDTDVKVWNNYFNIFIDVNSLRRIL